MRNEDIIRVLNTHEQALRTMGEELKILKHYFQKVDKQLTKVLTK